MKETNYLKSQKYTDYDTIFEQCSGPGGLQLAEFIADKMELEAGKIMLDVGTNRGYQTCFLVKEYDIFAVGIDPWDDREFGNPMGDHFLKNAKKWGVENQVLGIKIGVPDTNFASNSFDYIYSTTALEMIRESLGDEFFQLAIKELYRVLIPGGVFGLGEPMHLDNEIPPDLDPYIPESWKGCFRTLRETVSTIEQVGFEIMEAGFAPDAYQWWMDFAKYDPFCKKDPEGEPKTLKLDNGRWTSYGFIICSKPNK